MTEYNELTGRARFLARLDYLVKQCSEENWIELYENPLDETAIKNTKKIIENSDDETLDFYILFPSPNATLLFECRWHLIASMSVGNDGCSYAAVKDEKLHHDKEYSEIMGYIKPFNTEEAVRKLKEMKDFFTEEEITFIEKKEK